MPGTQSYPQAGAASPNYVVEKRKTQKDLIKETVELCDNLLARLRKIMREDPKEIPEVLDDFTTGFDLLDIQASGFLIEKSEKSKDYPIFIYENDKGEKVEWPIPELVNRVQDWLGRTNEGDLDQTMPGMDEMEREAGKMRIRADWGAMLYKAFKLALIHCELYEE